VSTAPLQSRSEAPTAPTSSTPDKVVAPPPGHPRFPLFDSIRGIAVLMALLGHCALYTGAQKNHIYGPILAHFNLAVVILFIVSGFLLYRPMVAGRFGGPKAPRIRDYTRRRALRVFPGYWLALTSLAILFPSLVFGPFTHSWWAFYGLLQVYPIYDAPAQCAGSVAYCGIPPVWSLSVELSFYVALPFAMLASRRMARGRPRMTALKIELAAIWLLAIGSIFVQHYALTNAGAHWLNLNLLSTFIWFACGMTLALLSSAFYHRKVTSPLLRPEVCWGAAIAVFIWVAYLDNLPIYPDIATAGQQITDRVGLALVAILLVTPAVFEDHRGGPVHRLLSNPVLKWTGLVSYGIFLYHHTIAGYLSEKGATDWIPGGAFFGLVSATFAITIVVAALSYYLVEKPFLRLK
jgi:peptidoglycan/LPS O-acetylase OafA/YrhL